MSGDDYEQIPGWAIRLEAKLDVAIAQHGAAIEGHARRLNDVEQEVRKMQEDPRVDPQAIQDHETRIRVQERKSTVSPRALAATVAGVLGAAGALAPFLDRLYS